MGSKVGGAAPGFEPWTSCLRVRSVTILLYGGRPRFFSSFFYLYFGGTVLTSRPPGGGVPVAGADLAGPTDWPGGAAGAMVDVTNRQSDKKEPEDIFFFLVYMGCLLEPKVETVCRFRLDRGCWNILQKMGGKLQRTAAPKEK